MASCKQDAKIQSEAPVLTAQEIIDSTIAVYGGDNYRKSMKRFFFRDKEYVGIHTLGKYSLTRKYSDSLGSHISYLGTTGFRRYLDGNKIETPDSLVSRYSNGVNSVHYFAYLPYGLNAKAVNKKYLGQEKINDKNYYKIEVTFDEDGGGDDFEDVFHYWIDSEDFTMDYLAYKYHTGKGGIRFREAYNKRTVNEIVFQDYNNYKPKSKDIDMNKLGELFTNGELELLSKIELENISVSILPE